MASLNSNAARSRILQAVDALGQGERRKAASLISAELAEGARTGTRWGSVAKLANRIGEIDMGLDASLRFAMTEPISLSNLLNHCDALVQVGRTAEGVALVDRLPQQAQAHPAVLHFRGTVASENGDFAEAEDYLRRSIRAAPGGLQGWLALTMIHSFSPDEPDYKAMTAIDAERVQADPLARSRFYHARGNALVDMGRIEEGFAFYEKSAALRRQDMPYDRARQDAIGAALIRDFTPANMERLTPSRFAGQRAIFVNGLPRSGTTLMESILVSHSQVSDGAEISLVQPALIPTVDQSFAGAIAYQQRSRSDDPWGDLARDYHAMLSMRFRSGGLVVDKTLSQSWLMGLLLHAMPDARVIWMRRRPEDVALSAYRTYFSASVPWSWSLTDIAHHMKAEDKLFAHWTGLYPDRILTVPYEEMVADPEPWIERVLAHAGLPMEPQVLEFHKNRRKVRTASIKQVRAAISTDAVGKSERFAAQLEPFRTAYRG